MDGGLERRLSALPEDLGDHHPYDVSQMLVTAAAEERDTSDFMQHPDS